ncbi:hypothetical protein PMAYCL1PPCAC_05204, partial [Pristionchus mayeri]
IFKTIILNLTTIGYQLSSLVNLSVSIFCIFKEFPDPSHFRIIVAVYECVYAIPHNIKIYLSRNLYFDARDLIDAHDDFLFFIMLSAATIIVFWK